MNMNSYANLPGRNLRGTDLSPKEFGFAERDRSDQDRTERSEGNGCGCARVNRQEEIGCCAETATAKPYLALAYTLPQEWTEILEPDVAMREGTQFVELSLPFTGNCNQPGTEERRGVSCRG